MSSGANSTAQCGKCAGGPHVVRAGHRDPEATVHLVETEWTSQRHAFFQGFRFGLVWTALMELEFEAFVVAAAEAASSLAA